MDALEFIREKNRMCMSFDDGEGCMRCPFYKEGNRCMAILWNEEIVPIVEKWSKEHPCKTPNRVKSTKNRSCSTCRHFTTSGLPYSCVPCFHGSNWDEKK